MDKMSVKMTDVSFRSGSASKTDSSVKSATAGDFKKLLQGQEEQANSREVSKENKKTENKSEKPADKKDAQDVTDKKDAGEDTGKDETVQEKTSPAESLLAAYQMNFGIRPEVIQAEPETEAEAALPEIQMEAVPQVQEEAVPMQTAEVRSETVAEAVPQTGQNLKTEEIKQPEAVETPKAEQKIAAPEKKADSSGTEEHNSAQTERHPAEQMVQAQPAEAPVQTEVQTVKPQEPVRMHVPEPEALPEKVTDQLLSKIAEGVQEFEIHIEPASLGKIAVKILYQEGQATVSIFCSEKRALDVLGRNAGEIGQVIEKNLGGTTTIIVDKQESDYLNQEKDRNQQNGQNEDKEQQKDDKKDQNAEDAEQFLQKLRLGLLS